MSESPFISTADRNTIAVASDTSAALLELSRLAADAYAEAKAARYLLQVAATSEKPEDRDEAYRACKTTQLAARAIFELTTDIDNDAGGLRHMSHNLVRTDR
jgi:hypothetical protein